MRMFKLTVIDECSYCFEQSYLCGVVDMVTPQMFIRKDRESMCIHVHTDLCSGCKNV